MQASKLTQLTGKAVVLAAAVLTTVLCTTPAQAVLIRVDIAGNVTSPNPAAPAMQAAGPFTAQITLDTQSPDQGAGGTRIAYFSQAGMPPAVVSYKIDGVEFSVPGQDTEEVSYVRQTGLRDILAIDTLGNDAGELSVEFSGILPLNFFGAGPYTLDQLLSLTLADFSSTSGPEIYGDSGFLAGGEVTSLSVSLVPEPSLLGLALGGLAFAARAAGGRGRR